RFKVLDQLRARRRLERRAVGEIRRCSHNRLGHGTNANTAKNTICHFTLRDFSGYRPGPISGIHFSEIAYSWRSRPGVRRLDRMSADHTHWMRYAIEQARMGIQSGQSPFGAVIVRNGELVAGGHNEVWKRTDPTAHAEVVCIQHACKALASIDLSGC